VTPVIRISSDVFRRLQAVSEPLVDTPGRVIDRLLSHYESTHAGPCFPKGGSEHGDLAKRVSDPDFDGGLLSASDGCRAPSLFLAPARAANLRESIERSISVDVAQAHLSEQQFNELRAAIAGAPEFWCWATSQGKFAYFDAMRADDYVLFTETGTGRFTYVGRVVAKFVSELLGQALWADVPGLPWKFIYVLDRVRRIDISKKKLVTQLGYERDYPVYGFIRVRPERVREMLDKYGDVEKLLRACAK
jgi:hypothetical protein